MSWERNEGEGEAGGREGRKMRRRKESGRGKERREGKRDDRGAMHTEM